MASYECLLCGRESGFPENAKAEAPCPCGAKHHICQSCYEYEHIGTPTEWLKRSPLAWCPVSDEHRVGKLLMGDE